MNLRATLGLLLVAGFATYASMRGVAGEYAAWRAPAPVDTVETYVERFGPIREGLPADARVQFIPPSRTDRASFWFHLSAAQHALAPVLLDTLPGPARVVVVFPADTLLAARDSLAVERDAGTGVVVLRRRNMP